MVRGKFLVFLIMLLFLTGSWLHFSRGYYDVQTPIPHSWGVDDAYISYRYGWNLVNHGILSWNESGYRKTEGFTNPLWVVLSAAWSLFKNKDLVHPGMVLTSVFLIGSGLYGMGKLTLENFGGSQSLIGLLLLAGAPFLWLHATSGLEGGVFGVALGLLVLLGNERLEKVSQRNTWLTLLATFVCVLRSDGNIFLVVVVIGFLVGSNNAYKPILFGLLLGSVIVYTSRWFLFGTLVPNTAIAKLNFDILTRVKTGALVFLAVILYGGVGLLVVSLLGVPSLSKPQRLQTVTILGGWAAYFIFIGGDIFRERHLIGMFVICAITLSRFLPTLNSASRLVMVSFVILGYFVPFLTKDPRYAYFDSKPPDPLILLGKKIQQNRDAYGIIVVIPAGKVPYYAGGDFVDAIGLNDPDLSKIRCDRFVPGHSSGSEALAVKIAKQDSNNRYSLFTFFMPEKIESYEDVLLWVDNTESSEGVHTKFSSQEWEFAKLNFQPLDLSLIVTGK